MVYLVGSIALKTQKDERRALQCFRKAHELGHARGIASLSSQRAILQPPSEDAMGGWISAIGLNQLGLLHQKGRLSLLH
jgi:TPR repeat protein